MKKIVGILLAVLRIVIVLTAIWLIVEYVYFRATGSYLVYHNLLLRAADNAIEELHIIHEVYNVKKDWLSDCFTNYFVPAVRLAAVPVAVWDLTEAVSGKKKYVALSVIGVAALIAIVLIALG